MATRETLTETYEDVRGELDSVARSFVRSYGGDYEEVRSEADWLFLSVYSSHTYGVSPFDCWLRRKVRLGLLEVLRTRIARRRRLRPRDVDLTRFASRPSMTFDLQEFLAEHWNLSEEAKEMVRLVVEPPIDIRLEVNARGDKPSHYRMALREYLKDIGWNKRTVESTFHELKESL